MVYLSRLLVYPFWLHQLGGVDSHVVEILDNAGSLIDVMDAIKCHIRQYA